MAKYAAGDGVYGEWVSDGSVYPRGVYRNGGMWHWRRTDNMIDPLPDHAMIGATVYRDLTLTDTWVEALPAVEVRVGSKVIPWAYIEYDPPDCYNSASRTDDPEPSDLAPGNHLTVVSIESFERLKVDRPFVIGPDSDSPQTVDPNSYYPDAIHYSFFRCAATGAPLCLPKEAK
jgi:hypothetical protein